MIFILLHIKTCNESPVMILSICQSWVTNTISMMQADIFLLAMMVMMIMIRKGTAFLNITVLFEAVMTQSNENPLCAFLAIWVQLSPGVLGLNVDIFLCVYPSVASVSREQEIVHFYKTSRWIVGDLI